MLKEKFQELLGEDFLVAQINERFGEDNGCFEAVISTKPFSIDNTYKIQVYKYTMIFVNTLGNSLGVIDYRLTNEAVAKLESAMEVAA